MQGGHVMHWQPKAATQPVLWLSSNARYTEGRSIRGGIPICWPWFGAHPTDSSYCPHGFARVIPWKVLQTCFGRKRKKKLLHPKYKVRRPKNSKKMELRNLSMKTSSIMKKQESRCIILWACLKITLENVKGEFESFGELLSVRETGTESLFQR